MTALLTEGGDLSYDDEACPGFRLSGSGLSGAEAMPRLATIRIVVLVMEGTEVIAKVRTLVLMLLPSAHDELEEHQGRLTAVAFVVVVAEVVRGFPQESSSRLQSRMAYTLCSQARA